MAAGDGSGRLLALRLRLLFLRTSIPVNRDIKEIALPARWLNLMAACAVNAEAAFWLSALASSLAAP